MTDQIEIKAQIGNDQPHVCNGVQIGGFEVENGKEVPLTINFQGDPIGTATITKEENGKIYATAKIPKETWNELQNQKMCIGGPIMDEGDKIYVDQVGISPENVDISIPPLKDGEVKDEEHE